MEAACYDRASTASRLIGPGYVTRHTLGLPILCLYECLQRRPRTHTSAPQISGREARKLNDKARKLAETAARNKLDALRDDDDVFDVSYERQGGGAEDTVSATDIKVGLSHRTVFTGNGSAVFLMTPCTTCRFNPILTCVLVDFL